MDFNRHSIRLDDFDYSNNGYYFVTICTQNRINYFCDVGADRCVCPNINEIGKLIDYWWNEIPKHFENVLLDELVVMPNHIHGIIIIGNGRTHDLLSSGRTHRSAPTIGNIIQWFKTMVTNEYIKNIKTNNWSRFNKRFWQRNYYEHIIRNEKEFLRIKEYIKLNPEMWGRDRNNL